MMGSPHRREGVLRNQTVHTSVSADSISSSIKQSSASTVFPRLTCDGAKLAIGLGAFVQALLLVPGCLLQHGLQRAVLPMVLIVTSHLGSLPPLGIVLQGTQPGSWSLDKWVAVMSHVWLPQAC